MAIFKCKMCGGTIEFNQGDTVGVCDSCGTKQTLPKLDDEKRVQLYDRANYFRRENEFDKAMGIYEMIIADEKEDAEAYWGIVLCKYGIEYVEDPRSHKRIPTVNRAQYTSVFDDKDYQSAIKYADGYQRDVIEAEAKTIDAIQKGILEISNKEEPFDVFICYKETDASGNRTQDSVYAQDIYKALTDEGYKVFFSRITLESKLGQQYEPYIFAALNSAKVMLAIGTSKENFEAVWVKNEWSRFLALTKTDKSKVLIPCYKDISPYDMPEGFTYLQSQDMGKIGFIQDLLHGISKVVKRTAPKETVVINSGNAEVEPLLKRASLFIEDENWDEANSYCEKVLDQDPENADAYLYKLLAELHKKRIDDLSDCCGDLSKKSNFQKLLIFGSDELKKQLKEYEKQCVYNYAKEKYNSEFYAEAYYAFKSLNDYKDACAKSEDSYQHYLQLVEKRKQQLDTLERKYNTADKTWKDRKKKAKKYFLLIIPTFILGTVLGLVLEGILNALDVDYNDFVTFIPFILGAILAFAFFCVGITLNSQHMELKNSLLGLKRQMETSQREQLPPEPSQNASEIPPVGTKGEEKVVIHGRGVYNQVGKQETNKIAYSGTVQNLTTANTNTALQGFDLTEQQIAEIDNLIKSGEKIAAIKAVREATGLSLKWAKDIVDNYK